MMDGGVGAEKYEREAGRLRPFTVKAVVSPRSEGLKAGAGTPDFRHTEELGDTENIFCVMQEPYESS